MILIQWYMKGKNIGNQADVIGVKCDVSIASQVISAVKLAVDKFGWETIDVLVNNAGVVFIRN